SPRQAVLARHVGLVVVDAGVDLRGDVVGEREALRDGRGVALGELAAAAGGVGLPVVPGAAVGHRLDARGGLGVEGEDFGARVHGLASWAAVGAARTASHGKGASSGAGSSGPAGAATEAPLMGSAHCSVSKGPPRSW
ncbi:MAG: hypothetical protein ACK559_06180, partial [bacterium]